LVVFHHLSRIVRLEEVDGYDADSFPLPPATESDDES
jgi:hypothetical protein